MSKELPKMTLVQLYEAQDEAIRDAVIKARKLCLLNEQWDMRPWFENLRKVNPLFKGVGFAEFCERVAFQHPR